MMNIKNVVDFETFYFFSLLETIEKKAKNKLSASLQKTLRRLIQFIWRGTSPLDSIEKLARIQGTSDLSIFFSDLFERLTDYPPEKTIKDIPNYADDFLNIFKELVKDAIWDESAFQETEAPIQPKEKVTAQPSVQLSLYEFIHLAIREKVEKYFQQYNPAALNPIGILFDRLDNTLNLTEFCDPYRSEEALVHVLESIEKLYQLSGDSFELQNYLNGFWKEVNNLGIELDRLSSQNSKLFQAFCSGQVLVSEVPSIPESEQVKEETPELPPSEVPVTVGMELSEEEKNLRWLLKDYIVHEIEEISKEILSQVKTVTTGPVTPETESMVLANFKVLKDLGQIHKYPQIESISQEISQQLKKIFQEKQTVPEAAYFSLQKIFEHFISYIDAELQNTPQKSIQHLEELKKDLMQTLFPTMEADHLIAFEQKEVLQPVFTDIHRRWIDRLRSVYNAILQDPENMDLKNQMSDQLNHLQDWYKIWKLTGALTIVELWQNWLRNPKQQEKFIKKYKRVLESLVFLSDKLFTTTQDEWTHLLEKLTLPEKDEEEFGIAKTEKAFQDVTLRHLKALVQLLKDESKKLSDLKTKELLPILDLLCENCRLVQYEAMEKLFSDLAAGLRFLPQLEKEKETEFRKSLAKIIRQMQLDLSRGFQELSFENLQVALENIFKKYSTVSLEEQLASLQELEMKPEEVVTEESTEQELKKAFQTEISKYLDELEQVTENLSKDLENDAELLKLGNILHTLKGSALIMNHPRIAELAGPLESLCELLSEKSLSMNKSFITLAKKALKALRKILDEKKVDSMKVIEAINNYIAKYQVTEKSPQVTKKKSKRVSTKPIEKPPLKEELPPIAEPPSEKTKVSIKMPSLAEPEPPEVLPTEPMLRLKEKDPELLEIFRRDAQDNLNNIENSLNLIEKFRYDKQTLQTIDHAVHEIRSAAKMLGFSEIARLVDNLEELVEIVNKKEPENWREIIPTFRKSMQIIRELSEKQQVSQELYDQTSGMIASFIGQLKGKGEPAEKISIAPGLKPAVSDKKLPSEIMLQTFIQEARQYIEDVNFILMKLEKNPSDGELAEQLMRVLHTLKGSSSMVYQDEMEKLVHACETLVENHKKEGKPLSPESFDLLFALVDEVEFMLQALTDQKKIKTKNYAHLLRRLQAFLPSGTVEEVSGMEKVETPADISEEFVTITDEVEPTVKVTDPHIRLKVKQMDQLLNEAAELVINNNQFKKQIERFKNFLPRLDLEKKNLQTVLGQLDKVVREQDRILSMLKAGSQALPSVEESQKAYFDNLKLITEHLHKFQSNFLQALQGIKESGKFYDEQLQKISRLSNQIHDEIIQARLVPISILFERFHRPLRDIAKKLGKKIRLFIEGETTEIDRVMAEDLYEPVLHILRNAIDHGIEPPEQRRKVGKAEEGLIKISAIQERNSITITIEDDGRGIDVEAIRRRVVELELLTPEQVNKRSDQEMYQFLMYPGFSTASQVSALSGRGIGLDVVRNQVQKLKGDLRIYSQSGKFTRFIIKVPISITVTQAMLVDINKNLYAIPLMQVEETLTIGQENLILKGDGYVIRQRGSEIPVIKMSTLLSLHRAAEQSSTRAVGLPIIIVQDEGRKAALLVDKILHREEILIKSLGQILQRVKYVMGGSILADGRVVLVLDIPQIVYSSLGLKEKDAVLKVEDVKRMEEEISYSQKRVKEVVIEKRQVRGRKPLVLVVDDSLSVRKFLSGMLSKHGYEVEVAKSGTMAIELLNQKEFDAVITDLEMPQVSGYELIEQIRSDPQWEKLPVIVLTGRASKHIEQHITLLGANEFVVKPFKESDLLDKLSRYIEF